MTDSSVLSDIISMNMLLLRNKSYFIMSNIKSAMCDFLENRRLVEYG